MALCCRDQDTHSPLVHHVTGGVYGEFRGAFDEGREGSGKRNFADTSSEQQALVSSRSVSSRAGKIMKQYQGPELAAIRGEKEAAPAVDTVVNRVNGNPLMIIRHYRPGAMVDPDCIQPAFAADPE